MPIIKRFAQLNAAVITGGAVFTAYSYPELRKEPLQLWSAMRRGLKIITTGSMMAIDYIQAGDNITSATHYKAANRMFDCFC